MNIRITMDIPAEKLTELQALLTNSTQPSEPAPVKKPVTEEKPKTETPKPVPEKTEATPEEVKAVTKTMIRAKGVELTKAGKQSALEEIFKKFGAAKLSALKEEDYAEAYKMMEEV